MQSNILLVWQGQCPRHGRVWPVLLLPFCGEAGKLKELVTHISYIFLRKGTGRKEGWVFERLSLVSLEKAMAPYTSTLAWKIPWMEEPGRLQSMGSLGVGHDWATSLSRFTFMHWRRNWQPTPVFLPGESQGRGSWVGCHLWGHTESDMAETT